MRIVRILLALGAALAAAAVAREVLARSRRDDAAAQAGMDLWPPVPRKPERAA